MRRTAPALALLGAGLLAALLAGCAQPGQLGQPAPTTTVTAQPSPPTDPVLDVRGTVAEPLRLRTPASADYAVRTQVLAPGEALGWEVHPGTELTLVDDGEVTVREAGACAPRVLGPGGVAVVGENVAHVVENTGTGPARLVVTTLLTAGAPPTAAVPPAC